MRFGIFYEHQLPRPWHQGSEHRLFQDALEQIEFADRLGFDYVWEVEHHFLEEYSHSSAPEVFLAAASQRTKSIRLGHGIVQTSPRYNHPARVAERLATLDLVSGGRVDFGSGESGTSAELGGFGIDPAEKSAQWREGLETVVRCLTETPFAGVDGAYVQMPPRNVVPKPVQWPHPPLWVACSRRESILKAARHGLGALCFSFVDPEEARSWVEAYEAQLGACIPIGRRIDPQLACVTPMMVHTEEDEAIRRGLEGGNFFGYSLAYYIAFGDFAPGRNDVWGEFRKKRRQMGYDPEAALAEQKALGAKVARGEVSGLRGAVGTPDQLREFLLRYEAAGVDQLIFILQAGNNRHEHIMESLELFAREVMPEFKVRDEAARATKAKRLEPLVEAALARRVESAPVLPLDYRIAPIARDAIRAAGGDAALLSLEQKALRGRGIDALSPARNEPPRPGE